jgi:hypothetical protein
MEVVSAASSRLQNRHTFAAGGVGSAQCVQGTRRSVGGWLVWAIYDAVGSCAAAFATGIVFNFAQLMVVGTSPGASAWLCHFTADAAATMRSP